MSWTASHQFPTRILNYTREGYTNGVVIFTAFGTQPETTYVQVMLDEESGRITCSDSEGEPTGSYVPFLFSGWQMHWLDMTPDIHQKHSVLVGDERWLLTMQPTEKGLSFSYRTESDAPLPGTPGEIKQTVVIPHDLCKLLIKDLEQHGLILPPRTSERMKATRRQPLQQTLLAPRS